MSSVCPWLVTDGFEFYEKVVRRVLGPAALYGQVLKTRRHDRVIQVERRARLGASWRFAEALTNSEDSSTLNTSFIERMNLTIRQGSAYLSRRTLAHARSAEKLARFSDSSSVNGGDPPALPGRHPEFDSSGNGMRNSQS